MKKQKEKAHESEANEAKPKTGASFGKKCTGNGGTIEIRPDEESDQKRKQRANPG